MPAITQLFFNRKYCMNQTYAGRHGSSLYAPIKSNSRAETVRELIKWRFVEPQF
jgi:hypothetical protein